jgi:hypothetical protein
MRASGLVVFCVCLATATFGQTFFPTTGPLRQEEVALDQANEVYIYFDNPSGDSLRLKWRRLETSFADGWDVDLCDYGICYIDIPVNGTMNWAYDSIQPYLKLIVQPGSVPGAGWAWFRVLESGNDANYVDVYFSLHTPGVTASTEPGRTLAVHAYPNPVAETLFLENTRDVPVPVGLFGPDGRLLWRQVLSARSDQSLPVSHLPSGPYFLQTGSSARTVILKN